MIRLLRFHRTTLVAALLALATAGCTGTPLVGHWSRGTDAPGRTGTATLTLAGDGTATYVITVPECTGAWTNADWTWSADGTLLRLNGTYTCTGSIVCGDVTLSGCRVDGGLMDNQCSYTLTDDQNTLSMTECLGSATTSSMRYTRAM